LLEALISKPVKAHQARFWSRGFRGSSVADFWVRPSHRSILLDLLLVEISEAWGPPGALSRNIKKPTFSSEIGNKSVFFDDGVPKSTPRGLGRCQTSFWSAVGF